MTSCSMLKSKYFERLGFQSEEALPLSTTLSKANLDKIVEAHLANVTFDNLAQHGLPFTATLDVDKTAKKILEEGRGGFCFELNGMLAKLLSELGYEVKRVPAIVFTDQGFRHQATHLVLIVSAPANKEEQWFVDVGFGEPAIHSLRYELDTEQETPEGMVSRLVMCEENPDAVILQWKKEEGWMPRLKWIFHHPGQELTNFQDGLDSVLGEASIFHQKLIVCKIDRHKKISLAGTKLKVTSPRFGPECKSRVEDLETTEAMQKALKDIFKVPQVEMLDLGKSQQAESELWSHM